MNGNSPTSLDKDALELIGVNTPDVATWPHTFAWWSLASKFSKAIQNSWPKVQ